MDRQTGVVQYLMQLLGGPHNQKNSKPCGSICGLCIVGTCTWHLANRRRATAQ